MSPVGARPSPCSATPTRLSTWCGRRGTWAFSNASTPDRSPSATSPRSPGRARCGPIVEALAAARGEIFDPHKRWLDVGGDDGTVAGLGFMDIRVIPGAFDVVIATRG